MFDLNVSCALKAIRFIIVIVKIIRQRNSENRYTIFSSTIIINKILTEIKNGLTSFDAFSHLLENRGGQRTVFWTVELS